MITVTKAEIDERVRRLTDAERAEILDPDNWPNGGPTLGARLEIGAEILLRDEKERAAKEREREQVEEGANGKKIAALERKIGRLTAIVNELDKLIFLGPNGDKGRKNDPEPFILRVIKGVAWELLLEKKVMRDAGIWDADKNYATGAAVTHDGVLWTCQQEHKGQRPGDGVCWRLIHKSDIAELKSMVRATVRDELHKQTKGSMK
jgi:hypothetical protein